MDNSANMRDITASIVDLAVRGYMVIEEVQKDRMLGLMHEKDYNFILQKDRSQWGGLKAHEQALLDGFFTAGTAGETISMDSLQNRFYKTLPIMRSGIFDSLVSQGFYKRRPDSVRSTYIGAGVVVGVLMIWGGGAHGARHGHRTSAIHHWWNSFCAGDLRIWLVHAGAHGARDARAGRRTGLRGFSESCGGRPFQSHDKNSANV